MATNPVIRPGDAVAAMFAEEQARGVDVFDGRAPGVPAQIAPLVQPGIPPADWRAEETERAQREASS